MSDITKRRSKKAGIIPREIIADERTLLSWISDHSTKLAYGFGAAILVLLISMGFIWIKGKNARLAQEDLGAALRFYWSANANKLSGDPSQNTVQLEQAAANFKDVSQRHEKAPQGLTAALYQAGVLFDLGQFQQAASILEDIRSKDEAVFSDLNANLLLARCYEAQDELGKAIEVFNTLRATATGDMEALIMMDLARCHELLGNLDQAISLYRELEDRFPESLLTVRAGVKLATLGVLDREEL